MDLTDNLFPSELDTFPVSKLTTVCSDSFEFFSSTTDVLAFFYVLNCATEFFKFRAGSRDWTLDGTRPAVAKDGSPLALRSFIKFTSKLPGLTDSILVAKDRLIKPLNISSRERPHFTITFDIRTAWRRGN